jgi:predicted unusual protein kinase regulating ubiquinone biosynthesis (AarF/ABC1/UbiB family)
VGLVNRNAKRGTLARGFQLGRLGLSLAGSYLGYQAQNLLLGEGEQRKARFHEKASRRVRDELGALKGAAMKLGQLLSMQSKSLPEGAIRELAALQMKAPGMHASLARAQFKASFGKYPDEVFREFDAEPFAAASLGQVHRATTRSGECVAVKIQYPAIRSAIENDFSLLRSATLPGRLTGYVPTALVDELQKGILEETDYRQEADNIEFFRERLKGLTYLTIPRVYSDLSTDRVLTMSYIEGETLGEFLKRKPTAATRNLIGERLLEMHDTQLHWLKAVHADHHPGNYLFQPDGRIGLVDFGSVKRHNFEVAELMDGYLERTWQKSETAARHFLALVFGPKVPLKRARRVLPLLELLCDLLYPRDPAANAVVDYRDPRLHELINRWSRQILREKLIPPDCALLGRAQIGLDHFLYELGAHVNPQKIWQRVLAHPA